MKVNSLNFYTDIAMQIGTRYMLHNMIYNLEYYIRSRRTAGLRWFSMYFGISYYDLKLVVIIICNIADVFANNDFIDCTIWHYIGNFDMVTLQKEA